MKKIIAWLLAFLLTGTLILFCVSFLGQQVIAPSMNEEGAPVNDQVIRREQQLLKERMDKLAEVYPFPAEQVTEMVDEATLREYFLPVFERCFREGKAQSVMTAYNRISGVPCSANEHLLQDILRDEWGFDGYVVSDDGAEIGRAHV